MTRSFLPHGVSSKARLADIIKSINSLGSHIIDLDATLDHVAKTVKDQSTSISTSISSFQESQTTLSQRLNGLEANQASILENQSLIMNLLCKVAPASGIYTNNVPKGKKKKREDIERKRDVTERGSKQAKKKAFKDKCKRNANDAMKDGGDGDGDNQPLSKRVRLAGYKRASVTTPATVISTTNVSKL